VNVREEESKKEEGKINGSKQQEEMGEGKEWI